MSAPRNLAVLESRPGDRQPEARLLPSEWSHLIEPQLAGNWLVKNWIPRTGVAIVYGHPGTAKSFFAVDMGFHIALGRDWFGHKTERSLVIYIAAEGARGLRNRVAAFRTANGIQGREPFVLIPSTVDLFEGQNDVAALVATIEALSAECGERPGVIIVDTLSKTMGAGKENGDDMAIYVNNCERLSSHFQCCVMPIHHRPKDSDSREPRGHSSLRGGSDSLIIIEGGAVRKATLLKQKDGEEDLAVSFSLRVVPLGHDDDGDEVTSCVIEEAQQALVDLPSDPKARAIAKLTGHKRTVFNQIGDVIAAQGVPVPDAIPDTVINRQTVGKVAPLQAVSDMSQNTLRTSSDINPDSARRAHDRAMKSLQGGGLVGIYDEWTWLK